MSAIDSTDKIRSDIEGLLADRRELLALRKVLDGYRHDVQKPDQNGLAWMYCSETDEEVIARLAGTGLISPPVGTTVTDQHCRILGYLLHWSAGTVVVATSGSSAAPEPNGTPSPRSLGYEARQRGREKVPPMSLCYKDCQEWCYGWSVADDALRAPAPKPTPLTDQRKDELRSAGRAARRLHGPRVEPKEGLRFLGEPISLDEAVEWARGWDEADAELRAAPKPIRLHAGQVWEKGGEEVLLQYLRAPEPCRTVHRHVFESGYILTDGNHIVTDANGWKLIAGPGFTG